MTYLSARLLTAELGCVCLNLHLQVSLARNHRWVGALFWNLKCMMKLQKAHGKILLRYKNFLKSMQFFFNDTHFFPLTFLKTSLRNSLFMGTLRAWIERLGENPLDKVSLAIK